jgi:hypothetical protein
MGGFSPEEITIVPGVTNSVTATGLIGALAGGTISTVDNSIGIIKGEISGQQAISNVAKETVGTGLSAAAGLVAMRALGYGGVVGIVVFYAAASLAKGFWDSLAITEKKASAKPAVAE